MSDKQGKEQLREQIWEQLREQIWGQPVEQMLKRVKERVAVQLGVGRQLFSANTTVERRVLHQLWDQLLKCPGSQAQDQIQVQVVRQVMEDNDDPR